MQEAKIKKCISGVYCYRNSETGSIVYIGKDKNLIKSIRHKRHIKKRPHTREYRIQKIDIMLQKYPEKYTYQELCFVDPWFLDEMEVLLIREYRPSFNITDNKD